MMSTMHVVAACFEHAGGCHCGALRWRFASAQPLAQFSPRACDCDFCARHRAAWTSDPSGRLRIDVHASRLQRYRQGSGQAEFLFCRDCGVLVAVVAHGEDGRLLGAANRNAFDQRVPFGADTIVSPQRLAPETKLARWARFWMPVEIGTGDTGP